MNTYPCCLNGAGLFSPRALLISTLPQASISLAKQNQIRHVHSSNDEPYQPREHGSIPRIRHPSTSFLSLPVSRRGWDAQSSVSAQTGRQTSSAPDVLAASGNALPVLEHEPRPPRASPVMYLFRHVNQINGAATSGSTMLSATFDPLSAALSPSLPVARRRRRCWA
ncbi:manganese transporter [Zalerion maritima]|uniref:Manganese transporter n=1 Tax=Zalerion maritima TaxID=339359 RepID=A0AAD5RLM4_9PEZI|nr:manganese transporter [Zalerion maritima]